MSALWKTETLADRLRALADELESAERFGLRVPASVIVHGGVTFYLSDAQEFARWSEYLEARPHESSGFRCVSGDANGLTLHVFTRESQPAEQVTA